ncbi:MAG TPA: FAD-binding protein, partial [Candidatus Kapabacteria bacterium]|nr:FAD-binding protein [Candidatus Kapabacteria bacterium]
DYPFINNFTVNAFNILYYNKQPHKKHKQIVHYNLFFYPLDAVNNWNRAYGKNGFLQYQFVVPFGKDLSTIKQIMTIISNSGLSSFLTVLKTFGNVKSPGMMSFPREGITMAVDFRMSKRTLEVLKECDKLVRNAGGVLYPAKDARMSREDFQVFYPQWTELAKYKDPKISSSFWRRVAGE